MSSTPIVATRTSACLLTRFSALEWSVDSLASQTHWREQEFGITTAAKSRRLSFRMLRYWYMERLLAQETRAMNRPLRILEVGVDRGQMKAFVDHVPEPIVTSTWDAADIAPNHAALAEARYTNCAQLDLEDEGALASFSTSHAGQYDVLIVLHLLEHLKEPHKAFTVLSRVLRPSGIAIGGYPVLPDTLCALRERQLRRKAKPHGHVSAFSPDRTRRMAEDAGMQTEWMSGAFAVRASGFPLEDYGWWHTVNTAFGALCPAWPGEVYWQMRRQ